MKKIGVCACYDTKNFGSMLQTYATCRILDELGTDYEIIRYTRKPTAGLLIRSIGRVPEKLKAQRIRRAQRERLEAYPEVKEGIARRNSCFDSFVSETFTKMSPPYDTFTQLREAARGYDMVLVGSDQLWLPQGYSTNFYNLMFVPDDIPKIAYATSFGVSEIPDSKKAAAKRFLGRIEHISVREIRGAEIVKELTGRDVQVAADPTLLFDADGWRELIAPAAIPGLPRDYIFCYFLGNNPDQREAVRRLAETVHLPVVTVPHLDEFIESDVGFGDYEIYDAGPAQFVNLIRGAACVCTDSFHGSVFSILHHKKFVTFNRFSDESSNSRNSRITSLLEMTGLKERRMTSLKGEELTGFADRYIDYDTSDRMLAKMRAESMKYLTDALDLEGAY